MIITIDGPSASGKTTIAKIIAEKLNLSHFDTGAMYRSVAYMLLLQKIPLSDESKVKKFLKKFKLEIITKEKKAHYIVNGLDITKEIRSEVVTNMVSSVSALPSVRKTLWSIQQKFAKKQGGVFDGRDMGSVVFPKAKVKIFLTATPQERAKRRLEELLKTQPNEAKNLNHLQMTEALLKRDLADSSRSIAPLTIPEDGYIIDSSNLSIEEVAQKILDYKDKKTLISIKKTKILYRTFCFIVWCLTKTLYRVKVYGADGHYPGSAILAPNHTSFLDPPIIAAFYPEELHFLAKESLFKNRFFGAFLRNLNVHPVSSKMKDIKNLLLMISILKCEKKIVMFPEGKRSENNTLQPLQPGVATLALKSRAAIIPVYIHGTDKIWNRRKKIPKLFGRIFCVFGSPIKSELFTSLEGKEAKVQITQTLTQAMINLKKWFEDGARGPIP